MSREETVALVRRYYAECPPDDGDPDKQRARETADELLGDGFVMAFNNEPAVEAMHGREAHKEFLVVHTQMFPGERWSIETLACDGDTVACVWRVVATHAASGNPVDVLAADFWTVRDGRLAALRRFLDFATLEAMTSTAPSAG